MYSGSDSTESQNYPQWGLNAANFQNMSNEQVDWAALAQQWIIMKEAGPPPLISTEHKPKVTKEQLNEGGEAPMDVENDKEEPIADWNSIPNPQLNDWTWNAQNQTWGWANTWAPPPTGVPPPMKPPLLPTPANYNQYNAPPDSSSDNANFAGYSTNASNEFSSGYWSTTGAGNSKQMKQRRFTKVNVARPVQPLIPETQPTLDVNKRKQLPAWIREGLEKMERDKQKQLEKEKEKQEREEYNEKLKQNEKETMEILKTTIREQQKSKFESDGDNSDDDYGEKGKKQARTPEPVALTPAEQMMNVRRTMTEILLKVTNREIETICREELQRYYKKNKASDQRVSAPSGANVTAKLGLGIYGGGSSGSDNSDDDNEDKRDSDVELKDSIKRKRVEFSKTEREIEDKLAAAENRKQEIVSRTPSPDTHDNDTQVDAKSQGNRKHTKTASKRPKSRSSSSSSDDTSSYTGSRKRNSVRRSSTSSSGGRDSKKTSRRRSRSTSRSRTPEKAKRKTSKRSRSRSNSKRKDTVKRYSRRSRSRSRSRSRRSRSSSYRRRRRSRSRTRSRSPTYSKSRRSRSRSRNRKRRSRSSSSGRGKRSRRR